jgi:hypothetical protein
MEIGEDELFQPSMAASGINSATLSEEILCAIERLLDVMEGRWMPAFWASRLSAKFSTTCCWGRGRGVTGAGEPPDALQPDKPRAQAH